MIKKLKSSIPVFFILFLAIVLRFGTLKKLMPFTPDESYLIYIAQTIIKDFHIIWIGWSALGFDLYLGPFWIYIISPFLILAKGDPAILGYLNSFFGVLTAGLLYWIGKDFFSKKVGLIASLLSASLPLVVFFDQKPYPPAVAFLSVLMTFSLLKTSKSRIWWLVFATAYGMVFHIHLSLILMIFPALYLAWENRRKLNKKTVLLSLTAFVVMVSPLIAFDYFHKGSNITAPLRAIKMAGDSKIAYSPNITPLLQGMGRVFYLTPGNQSSDEILAPCSTDKLAAFTKPPVIVSILSFSLFLYFASRKATWKSKGGKLLVFVSLTFLIPFVFLSVINPVEYYLLGFFPIFFLMIGITASSLRKTANTIATLIFALLVVFSVYTVFSAKGDYGLKNKRLLIEKTTQELAGRAFYLTEEGSCQKYGGWRYLFSVYGQMPSQSEEDKNFSWLHPDETSKETPMVNVVVKETRSHKDVPPGYQSVITQGGFSAYLYQK